MDTATIEVFIKKHVRQADAAGVVLGLSGGVDSAVTAHLCCRALGRERCLAVLMPHESVTPDTETEDALQVAENLGMEHKTIPIGGISDIVTGSDDIGDDMVRQAAGNLSARIRASILYYEGQKRNYLVAGTDNRSEHMIGYFTKYGDGACDMLPISGLYKTQVWELAGILGVPRNIIEKEPSPHLWPGHLASRELNLDYHSIDAILQRLPGSAPEISAALGIPPEKVRHIMHLHISSEHKRRVPPGCAPDI